MIKGSTISCFSFGTVWKANEINYDHVNLRMQVQVQVQFIHTYSHIIFIYKNRKEKRKVKTKESELTLINSFSSSVLFINCNECFISLSAC